MIALFPGQGSQHVGMAKSLLENFQVARLAFEEASEAIRLDIRKLCLEGPDSDLVLTANTQPALLTASIAAFRVAETELGFKPTAVAGHSLGEYSALVAAGSVDLSSAVTWVRARGESMQQAVPAGEGTMAAILSVEDETVEKLCAHATELAQTRRKSGEAKDEISIESLVAPANYNSPGQVVIAGSVDAVQIAIDLVKQGGEFAGSTGRGKAMLLQVSAPFHCRLMRPTRDRMATLFAGLTASQLPRPLTCSYVPNRTARLTQESSVVIELLIDQVDHPVLWKQSIEALLQAGHTQAVEFGPGKVLQGLCKRIPAPDGRTIAATGVSDVDTLKAFGGTLK